MNRDLNSYPIEGRDPPTAHAEGPRKRVVMVATSQMACVWDVEKNLERAENIIRQVNQLFLLNHFQVVIQAAKNGAQIILVQELFQSGSFLSSSV